MLSKQEVIELLRYPVYKVKLRLLYPPYTECRDVQVIGSERVDTHKSSIERTLFNYIHTKESVQRGEEYKGIYNKRLFDKGYDEYYLQIKGDEVHDLGEQIINELEGIVDIGTTSIILGLTGDGRLHKASNKPLSRHDKWVLNWMEQMG